MSDEVAPGYVRVRLDLSYDGRDFSGWAKQREGQRTVQGELEDAIRTVTRSKVTYELTVAGRTDAGVHARGQVAHVDLPVEVWAEHEDKLLRRLAGRLPHDVRVWRVAEAPAGFNARFSAIWRRYAYRVVDHPAGVDPLLRGHVLWHDWPLDVDAMNAAAERLVGEHDFAAYCKKREGATTIRTLQRLDWERDADGVITATVKADAFCHNMVRSLVGALLFVGDGHRPVDWPGKVLAAGVRDSAVHVVRPHGLTLEEVGYPADSELAARNREARNKRTLPGRSGGCC
ncbi:tRNA pseudouridine(38-40) synthase TruA [Streptomyces mobaraensis NBRC 13819 = DSM 40847]|uniref:tRNA pseudouridine synthase A n=1 Tax=Streptomyces mobaraensis (strain ATCC 29032 / DSM 40847 / JCM 4168 / NBRC 13819 / NCIMB 11159 / IPCR 16-22) TaxID=1223523 RepID=M3B092_STRM1|nr:tRNA pseudouridine(38-40) synthase TruA [Streptomyces mobaraensis]EME99342.1 tRNA pseudouridine synthase A [Streptomyces mobaraensis NBRC 13819 = DSM 40847]QTT74328.1 tRNA pseudouridine(38-40) synthase TruA [Streptomyces mobaraensis NBRC 13819 = DSM 40847]